MWAGSVHPGDMSLSTPSLVSEIFGVTEVGDGGEAITDEKGGGMEVKLSGSQHHMSRDARKPVFRVSDLVVSDTNRAVQSLKMARSLTFCI